MFPARGRTRGPLTRARRPRTATAALTAAALAATLGTAGCAVAKAGQTPSIQLATAYVPTPITPGATEVYIAIRNNDAADRLVSARLSTGGRVTFQTLGRSGGALRTVPSIAIPAHAVTRLFPDGPHMVVTGTGTLKNGKIYTLTLRFAHAGTMRIGALVTNPQDTGGSNAYMDMD